LFALNTPCVKVGSFSRKRKEKEYGYRIMLRALS
jgi:hypothetical protein